MRESGLGITITARNLASRTLQTVERGIGSLGRTAAQVGRTIGGLNQRLQGMGDGLGNSTNSGISSLAKLGVGLVALDLTAKAAGATFNALGNSISGALDREVEGIQSVNTAMQTLKLSSSQASQFVQDFNRDVAIAGKNLPVSAESINTFARTIIDDYGAALGAAGASANQVRQVLLEDSKRLAIAQASSGTSNGEAQSAIASFLGGSLTSKGFNQYKFFANNVALKNALGEGLSSRGISSTGDISALERINILNEALEKAFPQDAIDRLAQSGQAKISQFTDLLFDPEIGIFSLTKDLDSEKAGYQSVFTSFKSTLDLLIGSDGIFASLGSLSGIDSNAFSQGLKNTVDGFNNLLSSFNSGLQGLQSLGSGELGSLVGKFSADFINGILEGALAAIAGVDWGGVARTVVSGIGSFLSNLDWKVYLGVGLSLLAVKVVPIVAGAILGGITLAMGGVPVLIGAAIVAGVGSIVALIASHWERITSAISSLFNELLSRITQTISNLRERQREALEARPKGFGTSTSRLHTGASGFVPDGLSAAMSREMSAAPPGASPVLANSSELIVPSDKISQLIGSSGKSINLGGVSINVSAEDPNQFARDLFKILEDEVLLNIESAIA